MSALLAKIYLFLLLFSLNVAAMDEKTSNWYLLPSDVFKNSPHCILPACAETCKDWCNIICSEEFWKYIWEVKKKQKSKKVEDLTYRQNCELCWLVNDVMIREGRELPKQQRQKRVMSNFQGHELQAGYRNVWSSLEASLTQNPQVLATCYYFQQSQIEGPKDLVDCFLKFLNKTLDGDVLVIMPVLNSATKELAGRNLHDEFPNVLWIQVTSFGAGSSELIDVGAIIYKFSGQFNVDLDFETFFQSIGHLRSLRPDLSATKIRHLIKKTAKEGFINLEAAEKAIKECEF